jgi:hypothetical protein
MIFHSATRETPQPPDSAPFERETGRPEMDRTSIISGDCEFSTFGFCGGFAGSLSETEKSDYVEPKINNLPLVLESHSPNL